jgi:hypothetical protein
VPAKGLTGRAILTYSFGGGPVSGPGGGGVQGRVHLTEASRSATLVTEEVALERLDCDCVNLGT